jgi:hypothetical protein
MQSLISSDYRANGRIFIFGRTQIAGRALWLRHVLHDGYTDLLSWTLGIALTCNLESPTMFQAQWNASTSTSTSGGGLFWVGRALFMRQSCFFFEEDEETHRAGRGSHMFDSLEIMTSWPDAWRCEGGSVGGKRGRSAALHKPSVGRRSFEDIAIEGKSGLRRTGGR